MISYVDYEYEMIYLDLRILRIPIAYCNIF